MLLPPPIPLKWGQRQKAPGFPLAKLPSRRMLLCRQVHFPPNCGNSPPGGGSEPGVPPSTACGGGEAGRPGLKALKHKVGDSLQGCPLRRGGEGRGAHLLLLRRLQGEPPGLRGLHGGPGAARGSARPPPPPPGGRCQGPAEDRERRCGQIPRISPHISPISQPLHRPDDSRAAGAWAQAGRASFTGGISACSGDVAPRPAAGPIRGLPLWSMRAASDPLGGAARSGRREAGSERLVSAAALWRPELYGPPPAGQKGPAPWEVSRSGTGTS